MNFINVTYFPIVYNVFLIDLNTFKKIPIKKFLKYRLASKELFYKIWLLNINDRIIKINVFILLHTF